MKVTFTFIATLVALGVSARATANPRPLPYSYPNGTLASGAVELETYVDVNPLRVAADPADATKGNIWSPEFHLTTEFEYGLTDRVELGFYQVFLASPTAGGDNAMIFDGLKWRVRTRFADPGEWPIDVGLYLELETMHDEVSLEGKVNLERRIGPVRWMANLWVEESISRPLDRSDQGRSARFIINPTMGLVAEVTRTFVPGIEYWARGQFSPSGTAQDQRNAGVNHFLGPTVHLNLGKLWWSAGLYFHLNNVGTPDLGDAYGPVWFRSVIGLDL